MKKLGSRCLYRMNPPQVGAPAPCNRRFAMTLGRIRFAGLTTLLSLIGLVLGTSSASAQSCSQTLSAGANVGSAISSAAGGATICLNNGNYSGFTLNGVSKSPRVTVRALNGRSASLTGTLTISGNTNGITISGINLGNVSLSGASTREITISDFNGTGKINIDGITVATPNILIENFSQVGLNVANADPAGVAIGGSGRTTPIVTIRNATIDGGCSDGIRLAGPAIVENSRIMNKQVGSCPNDPHTDAMQFYGGPFSGTIIRGNYFYRNVQVLAAYDGVDGILIENNVFDPGPDGERRPCQIELYSDANSTIRHNTVLYRGSGYGSICLDRKAADDAGYGTTVVDNIANSIVTANGSTYAQRTKNLVRSGATGSDISGAPTYVGGATPTTFSGFALAAGSLGKGIASSPAGSDIGANTTSTQTPSTLSAPTNLRVTP